MGKLCILIVENVIIDTLLSVSLARIEMYAGVTTYFTAISFVNHFFVLLATMEMY